MVVQEVEGLGRLLVGEAVGDHALGGDAALDEQVQGTGRGRRPGRCRAMLRQ